MPLAQQQARYTGRIRTLIFFLAPRSSLCPLQRAVLRAVSTMLSALAGGWGRSAPPAPKLDPGAVLARPPPYGAATVRPALSRRSRAGPLPRQHAPPPAGPGSRGTGPEGGGRPESADTDELTNKLMRIPAPPAPGFSSQDAQPLSPPEAQLRISGVFAPFGATLIFPLGFRLSRIVPVCLLMARSSLKVAVLP